MKTAPEVIPVIQRFARDLCWRGMSGDPPPAPGSLLNPEQRQHKAVFHYGVTLFCSNCSKQFKKEMIQLQGTRVQTSDDKSDVDI